MQSNAARWRNLICGTVIMLFLGLLYAWSIFRAPLIAIFPEWTESQLSLTFTLSMSFFCIGGILGGRLTRRFQARIAMWISAVMIMVGFLGTAFLRAENPGASFAMLYIFYGVLCGTGVGSAYNIIIGAVTKWFPGRNGFAMGVLLMGFGFGSLILGAVVDMFIRRFGLAQTFVILAIAVTVVIVALSLLIAPPDASEHLPQSASAPADDRRQYSSAEMIRTSTFWILFVRICIYSAAGMIVVNSAASIAAWYGAPAVLGLINSVCNGGGRLLFGALFDRSGQFVSMTVACITLVLAGGILLLGAATGQIVLIIIGLLFAGLSHGSGPTLGGTTTNKFFGAAHYQQNVSITTLSIIPGSVLGPMVSSWMLERSGGEYSPNFVFMIILGAVSFFFTVLLTRSAKRKLGIQNPV